MPCLSVRPSVFLSVRHMHKALSLGLLKVFISVTKEVKQNKNYCLALRCSSAF